MRILPIIILLILFSKIYSQPGCLPEKYIRNSFLSISDSIDKNPKDYNLRWQRIQILRTNSCDKFIIAKSHQNNLIELSSDSTGAYYKLDVIKELSFLIDKSAKIDSEFGYLQADKPNFLYRRGEEYLSIKDTLHALADFEEALKTTNISLKTRVAKTLSDYYLSLNGTNRTNYKQNNIKALFYLDMVSPVEFSGTLTGSEIEPFIHEKKSLLEALQEDVRLEKYLLQLIQHSYYAIPSYDEFQINRYTEDLLDKISDLAYFYYSRKQVAKAKSIIELTLKRKPDDQHFYIYNNAHNWAPKYDLLIKIHQTQAFKNKDLELDNLLKRLYADPLFNTYRFGTEYLDNILKLYPNNPRVYLSWIYIKLMDEYFRGKNQIKTDYPLTINGLFEKVETLNYKGFELPYLKAIYFLQENEFNLALIEIDRAMELYDGAKLRLLKIQILKKKTTSDYDKIEKMTAKVKKNYFKYENLSELLTQVNDIATQ